MARLSQPSLMERSHAVSLDLTTTLATAPLSFGQERLWFLAQLAPESLAYNRPWVLRLRGPLDPAALSSALGEIVRRHTPLRTTIEQVDGSPLQRIHLIDRFSLPTLDLSELEDGEGGWQAVAQRSIARRFHLDREPPFRPELFRLAADDHALLLTTHHIGFDAWSESVLARELAELYSASIEGRFPSLPSLQYQYADYARWQRGLAAGDGLQDDLDYWAAELADGLDAGRLSADTLVLERGASGAGEVNQPLGEALTDGLSQLCAEQRATPFMAFAAATALLLSRREAAPAVTLGYPTAGRTRVEHEPLIGLFVNTLPLRLEVPIESTFEDLLRQARDRLLNGADHQRAPFERIVDRVQPPRAPDASPLLNVLLNFRNLPASTPRMAGLEASRVELPELEGRYDLSLHVSDADDGFTIRAIYPRARQSEERIRALLDQLHTMLEQAVDQPGQRLSAYSLIAPEHRQRLPDPAAPIAKPVYPTVLDMFLEQAQARPDAPALLDDDGVVGYGELEDLALREAAAFQQAGLAAGDVVALAGPPCVGRVAGTLAAFLCGAVIQPLDSRRALEDLVEQLQLAGTRMIARYQDGSPTSHIGEWNGIPSVTRPARPQVAPGKESGFHPSAARPDPATIFFTSGTTGAPKGIVGGHQSLAHMIHWYRETFALGPGDRSAMVNNLAFDISLRDVFAALCTGGAVCIPDLKRDLDSGRVIEWLADHGVTFVHLVPSIASYWLSVDGERSRMEDLRLCTFAGEPLTRAVAEAWRSRCGPGLDVVNLYGPTETTMIKTWYQVPGNPPSGVQPIGFPLPGSQVLVLTDGPQPAGFGEPGELVIRTPYRSHGYLDANGAAGDGFVANPWSDDPDDKLFRTGDLGRRRADGSLEYLGRLDRQVKVRGVRVDLAKIEGVLLSDPAIAACAVDWQVLEEGAGALVAYWVPATAKADQDALRSRAREQLAGDHLPTRWVSLESLPLTANGKLDRAALAELPLPAANRPAAKSPPQNELERSIQRIWERALNVGGIGVTDDYFDLGGHSLLALRIFAVMEEQLGVSLPISALFEAPTVRQLADRIRRGVASDSTRTVVAIQSAADRPPVFWIHAAGGHVLSYQRLARRLGDDQPFYAVQGRPPAGLSGFRTVEQLAAEYVDAIRQLQSAGPYFLGGLSFGGLVAWEMAHRLTAGGERVAFLGLLDTRNPAMDSGVRPLDPIYAVRERIEFHRGQLALRPWRARPSYLAGRFRLMLGRLIVSTLRTVAPDLAQRLAPTAWQVQLALWEADWARKRYRVKPYAGKLTVFRAVTQPSWSRDPSLGWREYAAGGTDLRKVPGTHVSIIAGQNLGVLAAEIRPCLQAAQRQADPSAVPSGAD